MPSKRNIVHVVCVISYPFQPQFSLTYLLSLETLGSPQEFKIKLCGFWRGWFSEYLARCLVFQDERHEGGERQKYLTIYRNPYPGTVNINHFMASKGLSEQMIDHTLGTEVLNGNGNLKDNSWFNTCWVIITVLKCWDLRITHCSSFLIIIWKEENKQSFDKLIWCFLASLFL